MLHGKQSVLHITSPRPASNHTTPHQNTLHNIWRGHSSFTLGVDTTGQMNTIKNVLHTRSYHSADCNTDHSLVCCKIKLQPKRFHHGKKQGNPCIDVSKISQPEPVEQFAEMFGSKLGTLQTGDSAKEKWATLQDTMHGTALASFGRKTSKSHTWFEASSQQQLQGISEGCTMASRRQSDQCRTRHIKSSTREVITDKG